MPIDEFAFFVVFYLFLYYNRDGDIMKSILVEIQCDCGFHTYRKSETLVLSDFEVDIRKALMENTYFTIRCPRCGKEIIFLHPFAYVDKKHHHNIIEAESKPFCEDDHHCIMRIQEVASELCLILRR